MTKFHMQNVDLAAIDHQARRLRATYLASFFQRKK